MVEQEKIFTKQFLVSLLKWQRIWIKKNFPENTLSTEEASWEIPDTPFTIEGLLWQVSEIFNWLRVAILEMRKRDGSPVGFPKFQPGSMTVNERIEFFLEENRKIERKVESLSNNELTSLITHLGKHGEQTVPLGQVVAEDVFLTNGYFSMILSFKDLKKRIEGEEQKWPPY